MTNLRQLESSLEEVEGWAATTGMNTPRIRWRSVRWRWTSEILGWGRKRGKEWEGFVMTVSISNFLPHDLSRMTKQKLIGSVGPVRREELLWQPPYDVVLSSKGIDPTRPVMGSRPWNGSQPLLLIFKYIQLLWNRHNLDNNNNSSSVLLRTCVLRTINMDSTKVVRRRPRVQ